LHGCVALYDYLSYSGDPNDIWTAKFFSRADHGVPFSAVNYVRDGKMRGLGLFVTPIEFCISCVFAFLVSFFQFKSSNHLLSRLTHLCSAGFFLILLMISGTRVWVPAIFSGVTSMLFLHWNRSNTWLFYLPPFFLSVITFFTIAFNLNWFDLSFQSRVVQYSAVFLNFEDHLVGSGFGPIGAKYDLAYDSSLVSVIVALGFPVSMVFCFIAVSICNILVSYPERAFDAFRPICDNARILAYRKGLVIFSSCSAFIFFFHESMFYSFYLVVAVLVAMSVRHRSLTGC
jgi:hypothetical protein